MHPGHHERHHHHHQRGGGENGGDLRTLMHALKEAVITRGRGARTTREHVDAIRAILKRATDEINSLN